MCTQNVSNRPLGRSGERDINTEMEIILARSLAVDKKEKGKKGYKL